jgi:protein ATS1
VRVQLPFKAKAFCVGRDFTHVLGEEGGSLILGERKWFDSASIHHSSAVPVCGWSTIYYLANAGLAAYGRNNHGQVPGEHLPPLKLFAAGSEHCIAVADDGRVLCWGWGEHGNCGRPIDEKGNVECRFNTPEIQLVHRECIELIAAGCATSFALVNLAADNT